MTAALVLGTISLAGAAVTDSAFSLPVSSAPLVSIPPLPTLPVPIGGGGGGAGWTSKNWSGYAQTSGPYASVGATWTVPTVVASQSATYSATWVGIDGFSNSSIIQTGTEQDGFGGSASYYAWWTTSDLNQPDVEQELTYPVHPGDSMSALVCSVGAPGCQPAPGSTCSTSCWTITIADASGTVWSSTRTVSYSGPGDSAEWIMEAPTVNGSAATLADYSTFAFDSATVKGSPAVLSSQQGGRMVRKSLVGSTVVSTPSAPDQPAADGFALAYGSTAPAAPTGS